MYSKDAKCTIALNTTNVVQIDPQNKNFKSALTWYHHLTGFYQSSGFRNLSIIEPMCKTAVASQTHSPLMMEIENVRAFDIFASSPNNRMAYLLYTTFDSTNIRLVLIDTLLCVSTPFDTISNVSYTAGASDVRCSFNDMADNSTFSCLFAGSRIGLLSFAVNKDGKSANITSQEQYYGYKNMKAEKILLGLN